MTGARELLDVVVDSSGVATVTMSDPASHNALSHAMVRCLWDTFARLGSDDGVRVILLAGLSDMFSSGASREVLNDLISGKRDPGELVLPRALLDCPLPCISAMAGSAIGGGFALGVAADIVLLAQESRYCLNFMNLGFTPGMGTTRLLEHVLSPAVAHELLLSGEARRGRDFAVNSGLNHILPAADVLAKATDLAQRIAEKPRSALVALKRVLSMPRRQLFEEARTQEALMHTHGSPPSRG